MTDSNKILASNITAMVMMTTAAIICIIHICVVANGFIKRNR